VPRENKPEAYIVDWINSEIHKDDEYEDIKINAIQGHEEDDQGCNWSCNYFSASGTDAEPYMDRVVGIVRQARELFNIG